MEHERFSTTDVAGRQDEQRHQDPGTPPGQTDERDETRAGVEAGDRDGGADGHQPVDQRGDQQLEDRADPVVAQDTAEPTLQGQQYSALLSDRDADVFLDRWREVQARFVDDPQAAVRDADSLVAELMRSLAERFAEQRTALEDQWNSGGQPETEQLRLALQEYRSFFHRLLST